MTERMQTVAETAAYIRDAERLLAMAERQHVITTLAQQPEGGDLVPGGGGIRKIRFAAQGKGKSGGVRVIYYYHSAKAPLFLLAVFGKGERANLSKAEVNSLAKAVKQLAENYGG